MTTIALRDHPGHTLRPMKSAEFHPLWEEHSKPLFSQGFRLNLEGVLSDWEKEATQRLRQNMGKPFLLTWGLFYQEEFVGWTFGRQTDRETYYMTNSAVIPAHQRRGLCSWCCWSD
ncbi:MAG: ribosomal protein S18 acetylase RimI-like enzyme, partial [Myxococcota bacterium]